MPIIKTSASSVEASMQKRNNALAKLQNDTSLSSGIKGHEPGYTLITRHHGQKQKKTNITLRRRRVLTNDSLKAGAVVR
jgi:hypothetical protein